MPVRAEEEKKVISEKRHFFALEISGTEIERECAITSVLTFHTQMTLHLTGHGI